MPSSELLRVFSALEQARVRYLVVGGVAVVLHGHLRVTADLDLVVDLELTNARAAGRAKDLQDADALTAILEEDQNG